MAGLASSSPTAWGVEGTSTGATSTIEIEVGVGAGLIEGDSPTRAFSDFSSGLSPRISLTRSVAVSSTLSKTTKVSEH